MEIGIWDFGDFDLEAKFAGSISRYDSLLCVYKMRIQKSLFFFFFTDVNSYFLSSKNVFFLGGQSSKNDCVHEFREIWFSYFLHHSINII